MIRGKISFAQETGPRYLQEDRYVHFPVESSKSRLSGQLLAVMDGHTYTMYGFLVSEMCREYIPRLFSIHYAEQAEQSLHLLSRKLDIITRNVYIGSTLSLVLVLESHSTITYAVMGDSPIFFIGERSVCVSPTHNVRVNSEERLMAEERGGMYAYGSIWIPQSDSIDRTPYSLQCSRALGDGCMGNVILHEPEIGSTYLGANAAILLTSDGVCDTAKDTFQDIALMLTQSVRNGANAELLMQQRLTHSKLSDNATILLWSTF